MSASNPVREPSIPARLRYPPPSPPAFQHLQNFVIDRGDCMRCGVCVTVCPFDILEIDPATLCPSEVAGPCVECALCPSLCPRSSEWEVVSLQPFGDYLDMFPAKASTPANGVQDGGVTTALLETAFKHGFIDSCLAVSRDKQWQSHTVIATTPAEVRQHVGSIYWQVPITKDICDKLLAAGVRKTAVVGVPCKISAIPLIQEHALPPSHEVALTIGLFCSESFTREGFLAAAEKVASVPVERISKIDIKGKLIVSTDDGREVHGSLKDLRDFMDSSCHRCRDYTAEAADISIGSVGAPERGFNVVIVRSERGRQLIQHATADNTITVDPRPMNRELLARLCRKKKGDLGG